MLSDYLHELIGDWKYRARRDGRTLYALGTLGIIAHAAVLLEHHQIGEAQAYMMRDIAIKISRIETITLN